MTAELFFQAHIFKQLCQQHPLQNVVISPLEVEMTLLWLVRLKKLVLEGLSVEDGETYLENGEKSAMALSYIVEKLGVRCILRWRG